MRGSSKISIIHQEPQEEGSYIVNMVIFVLKSILMPSMQVIREIVNILQSIAHILEVTLSPDGSENRR